MNKSIYSLFLLILISFSFYLQAVEERNLLPFYYLNGKPQKLKVDLKDNRLCRVKLNNVIEYKNTEVIDCYPIEKKFTDLIKSIQVKNSNKNELNLMFVDTNKKIIHPVLQTTDRIFTVRSIIYFKKTKAHHMELIDNDGGYYYFTYDPINITVGE